MEKKKYKEAMSLWLTENNQRILKKTIKYKKKS